jgi:hypothetical protein
MLERRIDAGLVQAPIANGALDLLHRYRARHRRLYLYDWVCMPLVYTQVGRSWAWQSVYTTPRWPLWLRMDFLRSV